MAVARLYSYPLAAPVWDCGVCGIAARPGMPRGASSSSATWLLCGDADDSRTHLLSRAGVSLLVAAVAWPSIDVGAIAEWKMLNPAYAI